MFGDAEDVDASGVDFHDEQDVEPSSHTVWWMTKVRTESKSSNLSRAARSSGTSPGVQCALLCHGEQFLGEDVPRPVGGRRKIPDLQRQRVNLLVRRFSVADDDGAEDLVARHHIVEGTLEGRYVYPPGDAQRIGHDEPGAEESSLVS
jgi:hypothetical protein